MSTYACSDLHGQRRLFDAIMDFLKPDDKLFYLGDAIDRGADGWDMFKTLMDDPRVTFICGNHEDMMTDALRTFPEFRWSREMGVWSWNGNSPTLDAINVDDPKVVEDYLDRGRSLPVFATYTNADGDTFWLSHAGCNYDPSNLIFSLTREDLIWSREHFFPNEWASNNPSNLYIVHGHTPIPYLVEELANFYEGMPEEIEPGAFYYADGHKIDIDCGAHFTGCTVLLNLDTFDEEVFVE